MDELRVLTPQAWVRLTRVQVVPANRAQAGLCHGHPYRSCALLRYRPYGQHLSRPKDQFALVVRRCTSRRPQVPGLAPGRLPALVGVSVGGSGASSGIRVTCSWTSGCAGSAWGADPHRPAALAVTHDCFRSICQGERCPIHRSTTRFVEATTRSPASIRSTLATSSLTSPSIVRCSQHSSTRPTRVRPSWTWVVVPATLRRGSPTTAPHPWASISHPR